MDPISERLLTRIHDLEEELEAELARRRDAVRSALQRSALGVEHELADAHRKLRLSLYRFLRETSLTTSLTVPIIYALVVPIGFLHLAVMVYQWTCFPAYGIPRVPCRPYIALDRRLPFLNAIEKLNCVYCGYANGVLALAREVASRTEQYWCPIKHERRIAGAHRRYFSFLDPSDAEGYRARLEELRQGVRALPRGEE